MKLVKGQSAELFVSKRTSFSRPAKLQGHVQGDMGQGEHVQGDMGQGGHGQGGHGSGGTR